MRIVGSALLALLWAGAAVAQPTGTVIINNATPYINGTNGQVLYDNNGVVSVASAPGTGCSVLGSQYQILAVDVTGAACTPDASATVNLGHLTLGASGTLGTLTLGGSSSGTAALTGGTNGTFTSASPWALSGVFTLTGASNALGTPLSLVGTNISGTAANLTAGTATAANGLNSATTTVVVNGATAPTNGQVLTATSGTAAGWATPSSGSITPGTTTIIGSTAPCFIVNSTSTTMACDALGTGVATAMSNAVNGASGLATYVLGSSSAFGLVKVDNVTVTASSGVISAVGGAATTITPGTTTVVGATAPCLIENSASTTMACPAVTANFVTAMANAINAASGPLTYGIVGTSGTKLGLLNTANVWSNQQSASITTLTISTATFTPDGTNNDYSITLVHASCPCTLANPSGTPVAGTSGMIVVTQSSTGGDTITTYGTDYTFIGGAPTLNSGANAETFLPYYVVSSTEIDVFSGTAGTLAWSQITGTPTTLGGYGITNAVSLAGTGQALTGGFHPTPFSIGTVSSGTTTIDCGNGPLQYLTNGGAFTLALSTSWYGNCTLQVINNASAGAITFSGFSEGSNTGDAITTTNTSVFDIVLTRNGGGKTHYLVSAYQ